MKSGDSSHLYHDSHFAGEALEARERIKARWVNRREERLLAQQGHQLHRAKETCRKRVSWEQDNVRRDLGVILARTPIFHSTVQNEKDKLFRRKRQGLYRTMSDTSVSLMSKTRKDVVAPVMLSCYPLRLNHSSATLPLRLPPPTKNGAVAALDNSTRLSHLSGTSRILQPQSESPPDPSSEKIRFPPISNDNTNVEGSPVEFELETLHEETPMQLDSLEYPIDSSQATASYAEEDRHPVDGAGNVQTTTMLNEGTEHGHRSNNYSHQTAKSSRAEQQSQPPKINSSDSETTSVNVDDMMPVAKSIQRSHKYHYPNQPPPTTHANTNNMKTQNAPSTLATALDLSDDSSSHGHHRGADLRRRCHRAVMAIVRVQTRKEQRLRAGSDTRDSITLPPAMGPRGNDDTRQYRLSGPSTKSIADLSKWMSMSTQDPAQSRPHPGSFNPRQDHTKGHPASKQSWLSFPLPDL